jgi:hypothetical protein
LDKLRDEKTKAILAAEKSARHDENAETEVEQARALLDGGKIARRVERPISRVAALYSY